MKWITKIINVKPYKITCIWNNGEIRVIDMEEFINKKGLNPKSSFFQLKDKKRFLEVKSDGTTIYWEKGIKMTDHAGKIMSGPLDIDPEVLYEMSKGKSEKTKKSKVITSGRV